MRCARVRVRLPLLIVRTLTFASVLSAVPVLAAAPQSVISQDVPVPGGLRALAQALGIEVPDRARCVPELARLVYANTRLRRDDKDSRLQRLVTHLRAGSPNGTADQVPMPLSAGVWSQAVFRRTVGPGELFAAVMSDPAAALVARGLAALDDETLRFFNEHPESVTWLYDKGAGVFAGYAVHFRIHNNRVVPPGGDGAVPLWEALLNAKTSQPGAFLRELFGRDEGRLAYLYDVIGHLDPPRAAFALGLWIPDSSRRIDRFRALASVVSSAFPEWHPDKTPFARPAHDLMSMFSHVRVAPTGAPAFPASRSLWSEVFDGAGTESHFSAVAAIADSANVTDAAWLADALVSAHSAVRADRLDQFAFGQRVFATMDAASSRDTLTTVAAFPGFRMLLLTLERIGVERPAVYAAVTRQAHRLSALGGGRASVALAQFQGAIAIIDRLVRVRRIDRLEAEALLGALSDVPIDRDRGYLGGLAPWLQQLGATLGGTDELDRVLFVSLAGTRDAYRPSQVSWEGHRYVFDLVTSEAQRLERIRTAFGDLSIDGAITLHAVAQKLLVNTAAPADVQAAVSVLQKLTAARSAGAIASKAVAPLSELGNLNARSAQAAQAAELLLEVVDVVLAESLLSLAYAADWSPGRGGSRLREAVGRHDFGCALPARERRTRVAWSVPRLIAQPGQPWHIEGAALGLDLALGPFALRRISADALASAPAILSTERDTFIKSLALMNAFTLRDDTRDAIVDAIERGQRRVDALDAASTDVNAVIRDIAMDGWRARALRWTIAHDPQGAALLFSMSDLLYLGGGGQLDFNAWGMSAVNVTGCLCLKMPAPGVSTGLVGRPHIGLMATTVVDLHLRVAVILRDLQLPAALAKSILAAAVQDYVDRVKPSDADDWLTLVRAAQGVPRERIEDYIAAMTFGGPLLRDVTSH